MICVYIYICKRFVNHVHVYVCIKCMSYIYIYECIRYVYVYIQCMYKRSLCTHKIYVYVNMKCMHKRFVYMHVQNRIEQMYELTIQHECIQRMYRRSLWAFHCCSPLCVVSFFFFFFVRRFWATAADRNCMGAVWTPRAGLV